MSPSTRKKPKNRVVSKTQDKKLQDKTKQPVSKLIERNRLKMVLRNLSLLKLLKGSNGRIQGLHSLARRCWNSMLGVPKVLQISSGDNDVYKKVKQNKQKLQETASLEKKPDSKKEVTEEHKQKKNKEWKLKERSKGSRSSVPLKKKKAEPRVSRRPKGHGLSTRSRKRKPHTKSPRVVLLKTYHHRTPMGDMKQLDVANQLVWFEGLPTRIHLPGPRVMCRSSTLRWVKRACTRFCSVSL